MTREAATRRVHELLVKHGLHSWHVRLSTNDQANFLGMCLHADQCIIINAHHLDLHSDEDCEDTFLHEIAHALTPGHGHDEVWQAKAKELGASHKPCTHLSFPPEVIDAIRSGASVEVTFTEHTIYTPEVIKKPEYKITRLQDRCAKCGKVAIKVGETVIPTKDENKPDMLFVKLECGHTIFKTLPKGTPFHKFQAFGDPTCDHEWSSTEINTCVLCGRKRPFPYQIEGMKACERALSAGTGFAILDEMGLGKTQQAIGTLFFHPEDWPVLYVVKSGSKFQWLKAILDWTGDTHIAQVISKSTDIVIPGLKAYIISYDLMVKKTKRSKTGKIINIGFDVEKIINSNIKTIVLDECQLIKNADSGRTKAVRRICKDRKVIALSGTPWKNRGGELYSMFNMIAPNMFPYHNKFLQDWVEFVEVGKYVKQCGIKNPLKFRDYIKNIAIRRERKDVMPELPSVTRTKLLAKLSKDEEVAYDEAVEAFVSWYEEAVANEEANAFNILGKISRLRHLTGIAKIGVTLNHITEFVEETDRKLVVFAHHDDVCESIYLQCKERFEEGKKASEDDEEEDNTEFEKIPVMRLHSGLSGEERFAMQTRFNELPRAILIASTLASGEALNLQTCADCIMHERQWNPANEEQAEGRFIRIGQTAPEVNAIYAQVVDSIDDYLDQIVERKRRWFHSAHNTGEAVKWNQDDIVKELADLISTNHRRRKPKPAA